MKIPTINLTSTLKVTTDNTLNRLNQLDGLNKKAFREEYTEWIEAIDNGKDQTHALYTNQINIEQL